MFNINDMLDNRKELFDNFAIQISNIVKEYNMNKSYYTIDRFEGEYAVCENSKTHEMVDIPIKDIPKNAEENDILIMNKNQYMILSKELNNKKREKINNRINNLWE